MRYMAFGFFIVIAVVLIMLNFMSRDVAEEESVLSDGMVFMDNSSEPATDNATNSTDNVTKKSGGFLSNLPAFLLLSNLFNRGGSNFANTDNRQDMNKSKQGEDMRRQAPPKRYKRPGGFRRR